MDLPSGLDVNAILISAMQSEEYRSTLLTIVGFIWGLGFVTGVSFCAIFINPKQEFDEALQAKGKGGNLWQRWKRKT